MIKPTTIKMLLVCSTAVAAIAGVSVAVQRQRGVAPFQVEEATIASIHAAIKSGQTTCQAVVQAYIDRAKAYNGVCTAWSRRTAPISRRRKAMCAPARRSSSRPRP